MTIGLLLGCAGSAFGALLYTVKREPAFYRSAPCPSEWDARERSAKLITRVQDLKNEIRSKPEWGDTFTAEDLNCFFQENMGQPGGLCSLLPKGCHSPRVAIDGDRLRIGFRYRDGFWSSVVWIELKVWLVANETNLIAVEVCDLSAGGLPIGSQSILDSITESARNSNVEVTWYRNKGNPVGLFRLYADQPRPAAQVRTLEVKDGMIVVAGVSFLDQPGAAPVGVTPTLP
jgi:hypothetical protein